MPATQTVREAARRPEAWDSDHVRNVTAESGVASLESLDSPSEKLPLAFYSSDDVQFKTNSVEGLTSNRIAKRGVDVDGNGMVDSPSRNVWLDKGLTKKLLRKPNSKPGASLHDDLDLFGEASPARKPSISLPKKDKAKTPRFDSRGGGRDGYGQGIGGGEGKSGTDVFFDDLVFGTRLGDIDGRGVGAPEAYEYVGEGRQVAKSLRRLGRRSLLFYQDMEYRGGEQYEPIIENPFIAATGGDAISTFAIDVDTASYANMRRFINDGTLPPPNAVRLEELINYFGYEYKQPKGDDPFSVNLELASCPWDEDHQLLRVGLQGKDVHVAERPATNVVFLIDVSGSMQDQNKLPLLKRGFQMLVEQLNEDDRVSIVTYAGNAGVALDPTSGNQKKVINEAIEKLTPGGSTHGSAGIELAYQLAQKNFIPKGSNKVILATDGDLNVGVTNDDQLVKLIKGKAAEGVFLTVLGFGTGNLKDGKLEKLADNGNGVYSYIDSLREAHKVLVEQLSGALLTIAKDVKIQIEFNPAEVKSYRLLGYENRALKTEDFDNDRKDAGEIGAGHSVTALYEILPAKSKKAQRSATPVGMKYQNAESVTAPDDAEVQAAMLSKAAKSGELATVAVRYKQPDAQVSQRLEFAIANQEKSFSAATDDFRFASSVAAFGMLLRGSAHSGDATLDLIEEIGSGAIGADPSGYRAEFVDLVRKAAALSDRR